MFDALIGNRNPLMNNKSLTAKQSNAKIRKTVAERFVAAREMNGLSQTDAAKKIGFATSAQLCQWEQGKRLPPIDKMIVASLVYGTSLDYLYALSDEPERDPRRAEQQAMVRHMEDMLKANAEAVSSALVKHVKTGGANMLVVRGMHAKAVDAAAAIRKFEEINRPKFENLRGGATVLAACAALETLAREAEALIARHDGLREDVIRCAEVRSRLSHPLFETAQYRQGTLGVTR